MTEDEELQAALEASKKEAERAQKTHQQQQWSGVAKQPASTHNSTVIGALQHNPVVVKPKSTAVVQNVGATAKTAVLPPRSPTNPWATNHAAPTASTELVPALQVDKPSGAPDRLPQAPTAPEEMPSDGEQQFSEEEDEMFMVPIATRLPPSISPSVKPIARPLQSEPSSSPNGISNIVVTSVLESEIAIQSRSPLPNDALSSLPHSIPVSAPSSGISSPVPFISSTSSLASLQQLQDVLQTALLRIAKLEQDNERLASHVKLLIDNSTNLDHLVMSMHTENVVLKSQVAELRSKLLAPPSPLQTTSTDPTTAAYLTSHNSYAAFFNPHPFSAPNHQTQHRPQTSQALASSPLTLGMPNSLFGPPTTAAGLSHTQASSMPQAAPHGLNSPAFTANGFLN